MLMLALRQIGGAAAAFAIAVSIAGQAPALEPPPVVKIMVGSVAGGILDPYARIVGEHMSKTLGRTIIVENKPGANGNIAAQYVADQPADGTWLWVGTQAMTEINPSAYKNLRWGIDDFIPSVPARNLDEWIAWVKANPGKLGYASFSPGTPSAFLGHQLNKRFGLDLAHIVYKGSGPQTQDMVAGHSLMGFMQLGNAIPHIKAGKIIPIAVTSAKRSRFLPDVPTFAELGYDDFTAMVWFGLLTKKGTPEPIVKAYIAAAEKAHRDPEVQAKFEVQGMEATGITGPEKLTADIKTQIERWRKIVDETGFKAD
jgi:tripartite-type tricarboxylate transporter receptor subunit TctC